jgi:hypothetical protein
LSHARKSQLLRQCGFFHQAFPRFDADNARSVSCLEKQVIEDETEVDFPRRHRPIAGVRSLAQFQQQFR